MVERLTNNEIRDITKTLEEGKFLDDKYRYKLFKNSRKIETLWEDKDTFINNIVLPFQTIEHIDEPRDQSQYEHQRSLFDTSGKKIKGWTNKLVYGDNKFVLSSMLFGPMLNEIKEVGGIKLVYIDPPFSVGQDYTMQIKFPNEIVEKPPSLTEAFAYNNTWDKGGNTFLQMIYDRVKIIKNLLREDGALYLRIDYHWSHYVKSLLDEVFGIENFRNEIFINRTKKNVQSTTKQLRLPTAIESIFVYSKSDEFSYVDTKFKLKSTREGYWRALDDSAGQSKNPERIIEGKKLSPPPGKHFKYTQENIDKMYKEGRIRLHPKTGKPQYFVEAKDEGDLDTDWTDIPGYSFSTKYPTENSEQLLDRVIKSATEEGDLVCDFFGGSGTTAYVAEKLNRKWITSDIGRYSTHTIRKRLINLQREKKNNNEDFRSFEILTLGNYLSNTGFKDSIKNQEEFITLILNAYKSEKIDNSVFHGVKGSSVVYVGHYELPLSELEVNELIDECVKNNYLYLDVLSFEFGLGIEEINFIAEKKGVKVNFFIIPREVFSKSAIDKGLVNFYPPAFLDATIVKKRKSKTISVKLNNFSTNYSDSNIEVVEENMKKNSSKLLINNGQIIKASKDREGIFKTEVQKTEWYDWIDYWAVDFNFEDREELVYDLEGEEIVQKKTGRFIFDNQWQSFRFSKTEIELETIEYTFPAKGNYKIAIKVIDVFGNDSTKILEYRVE